MGLVIAIKKRSRDYRLCEIAVFKFLLRKGISKALVGDVNCGSPFILIIK